jgi:hypothetical protein
MNRRNTGVGATATLTIRTWRRTWTARSTTPDTRIGQQDRYGRREPFRSWPGRPPDRSCDRGTGATLVAALTLHAPSSGQHGIDAVEAILGDDTDDDWAGSPAAPES